MTTPEQLALGIRQTPQRLAIAEVVVNSGDHPSVKEIYQRVKEFFPYVTLATVYSTLETLEQAGIVRALPFQKQSRYDANLSPHANLVCVGCGGVVDSSAGEEILTRLKSQLESYHRVRVHRSANRLLRLVQHLRRPARPQGERWPRLTPSLL